MSPRIYFLIGFSALIAILAWQFPHGINNDYERARLIYLGIWVAVISGSPLLSYRLPKGKMVQYCLLWVAIALSILALRSAYLTYAQ